MNKSELVEVIATSADISKTSAGKALDAVINTITDALKKGDKVALLGFGTFTSRKRAARNGRNPQSGEVIQIKEAMIPIFKAGQALKEAVQTGQ